MDRDLAVLAGDCQRHLRLEIKMLLPANLERPLERVLGRLDSAIDFAAFNHALWPDEALGGDRVVDAEDRRLLLELHLHKFLRRPQLIARLSGDDAYDITNKHHLILNEQMLIGDDRPKLVMPRHILGG